MGDPIARLAKVRVPLGFATAAATLVLATPTPQAIMGGALVALAGEAVRVWAAGHLEKSREVTKSGPYRFVRHPLYVGSAIMAAGLAIASANGVVAVLVGAYFAVTVAAAVKTEEAFLRSRFGPEYDEYCNGTGEVTRRRFSWERAWRNREWRAIGGLALFVALLAAKLVLR